MLRVASIAGSVILLATVGFGSTAQAQVHIDFGFTHGHYHGHHHGWHHHHWDCHDWYRPYWYGPHFDYVYVVPPAPRRYTVVEPAPAYSYATPAPTQAAAPTPATPTPATRLAARSNDLPTDAAELTIRNPSGSGGRVFFVLDEAGDCELAPGQSKTLRGRETWQVEFDRGGDFGTVQRELTPGEYSFVVTDEGWDLRREESIAWRSPTRPAARKNTLPATRR
jgi:hypothetical protein